MRPNSPFYIGSQFFLMLFVSLFATAQLRDNAGTARVASFKMQQQLNAASPYKNLQWRNVGPDLISGRVTEVAGIPGNRNIIFASFATGGFWKTVDAGENWMPLTDQLGTLSIGAFALAPSNPDIIYLGTGESNIFRASLPGMGAYKSIDWVLPGNVVVNNDVDKSFPMGDNLVQLKLTNYCGNDTLIGKKITVKNNLFVSSNVGFGYSSTDEYCPGEEFSQSVYVALWST